MARLPPQYRFGTSVNSKLCYMGASLSCLCIWFHLFACWHISIAICLIKHIDSSQFLYFYITLAILISLPYHIMFKWFCLYPAKVLKRYFIEITLNLYINLRRISIFRISYIVIVGICTIYHCVLLCILISMTNKVSMFFLSFRSLTSSIHTCNLSKYTSCSDW